MVFMEIRKELTFFGCGFDSGSDTEIFIEVSSVHRYGVRILFNIINN